MNELVLTDLKTKISVGKITSNAAELLAAVKRGVEKYHDENYIPTEAAAKADRAELNRAEKAVAAEAKKIITVYNSPLEEFNWIVSEIRKEIKEANRVVDTAVKNFDEKEKGGKRLEIQTYFDGKNFDLAPLEKIFNHRWLNKTVKTAEWRKEVDDTINMIYGNIKTLEGIAEYGPVAKALYLDTLDMGAALRKAETLKENAGRLAREKLERAERERLAQIAANAEAERLEEKAAAKEESVKSLVDEALGFEEPEKPGEPGIMGYNLRIECPAAGLPGLFEYMAAIGVSYPEIVKLPMPVSGTKEPLFKLREYMTANGISYVKL